MKLTKERQLELIRELRDLTETSMYNEFEYSSYMGRGACGDRWPAFNVDDLFDFIAYIISSRITDDVDEVAALIKSMSWDSPMAYWRIKLTDPEDLDDDEEE